MERIAYALFKGIFKLYADPNTELCHMDVRILLMIVVGPSEKAMA